VPIPIQLGSITDRLRKFFRIRGKTGFLLDEVVAPVVLVQDLTVGPYQAGVTPAAGAIIWNVPNATNAALVIMLNDKSGSPTPELGQEFDGRSFSVTWIEIQNVTDDVTIELLDRLEMGLDSRASAAANTPISSARLISIQDNDGKREVPVEMFGYDSTVQGGSVFWRGLLGDNTNTLGSRRTYEPTPNLTIGPGSAIVLRNLPSAQLNAQTLFVSVRGFYQEQPS